MDWAYILFWPVLAMAVGTVFEYITDVVMTVALIHGRDGDVRWNFGMIGLRLMLWVGLTAFLWHYNFG